MSKYTKFNPTEAQQHANAMMQAEFDNGASAMKSAGATLDEIAKVRARATRLKQMAPFLRWLGDRQKGLTPEWMNND